MGSILNQSTKVVDGMVVINQETEQTLTRGQLIEQIIQSKRRKEQLVQQSKQIKTQYDQECLAESEFQKMLDMLPEEAPKSL